MSQQYGTIVKAFGAEVFVRPDGNPNDANYLYVVVPCQEFYEAEINPVSGTRVKYRLDPETPWKGRLVGVQVLCWKDTPIKATGQPQPEYAI